MDLLVDPRCASHFQSCKWFSSIITETLLWKNQDGRMPKDILHREFYNTPHLTGRSNCATRTSSSLTWPTFTPLHSPGKYLLPAETESVPPWVTDIHFQLQTT